MPLSFDLASHICSPIIWTILLEKLGFLEILLGPVEQLDMGTVMDAGR
ncbi:MAG: hypothetical protein ACI9LE_000689 [Paraglaciecola sp.]|jgi:hypothetical protein